MHKTVQYGHFSREEDRQADIDNKPELPPSPSKPASHDLRFIVSESVNLGVRIINEIDRMIRKING